MVELYSKRFYLRELTLKDASPLYLSWLNDIHSRRFIAFRQDSIDELQQYIQSHVDEPNTLFLGIFCKSSHVHIGNVKFFFLDPNKEEFSMGIMIGDENWQGKGVAGEVLSLFSIYSKEHYGSKKMILQVETANASAVRAYEKLGFKVTEVVVEPPSYIMTLDFSDI
jgi:RimJ/RimL family protein N-acetyltransferase